MIEHKTLILCYEYDLSEPHYLLLKLIEASGPLRWDTAADYARLKEVSGNPAALLRHLVDRGLLSGPARGEKIQAAPFGLTDEGRDLLGRIERGLHTPVWLSEHKVKALEVLSRGRLSLPGKVRERIKQVTLNSLIEAGYVEVERLDSMDDAGCVCVGYSDWVITDLGWEALGEWAAQNGEAV